MDRWIIDDVGTVRDASRASLNALLGLAVCDTEPEQALQEDRAIRNVGVVLVEHKPDGNRVRFRPDLMSAKATAAVYHWLLENRKVPVTLDWYDQSWCRETVADGRAAIDVMSALATKPAPDALAGRERIVATPSTQAFQHWNKVKHLIAPVTSTQADAYLMHRVLTPLFLGRWTVIDVMAPESRIEVAANGPGYPGLPPSFAAVDINQSFDAIPDLHYRAWLINTLFEVARSGKPTFDAVDAYISWHRFGDVRSRYWRLLVPLWSRPDRVRLLSASGSDSGIDLRP